LTERPHILYIRYLCCFISHAVLVASEGYVTVQVLPTGRAIVLNVEVAKVGAEGVLVALAGVFCIFIQIIVTTINWNIAL
jgi:hypothetical protein